MHIARRPLVVAAAVSLPDSITYFAPVPFRPLGSETTRRIGILYRARV